MPRSQSLASEFRVCVVYGVILLLILTCHFNYLFIFIIIFKVQQLTLSITFGTIDLITMPSPVQQVTFILHLTYSLQDPTLAWRFSKT